MSAHDGWVYLDVPPQPERRRPATVAELAAHQASCPECRDPWFANEEEGDAPAVPVWTFAAWMVPQLRNGESCCDFPHATNQPHLWKHAW